MKFCRDCKWNKKQIFGECEYCNAPKNIKYDIVSGDQYFQIPGCHEHRTDGWLKARRYNTCGKEGRWWEAKE